MRFPTTIEQVEAEEKRQEEEAEEITPALPSAEEILEKLSTTRGAGVLCAVNTQPKPVGCGVSLAPHTPPTINAH